MKLPRNANSVSAIPQLARLLGEGSSDGLPSPGRTEQLVRRMLAGKPIPIEQLSFENTKGVSAPSAPLIEAQLVKLLTDIGQGGRVDLLKDPHLTPAQLQARVELLIGYGEGAVRDHLRVRGADDGPPAAEELAKIARQYSPELVLRELFGCFAQQSIICESLRGLGVEVGDREQRWAAAVEDFARTHGRQKQLAVLEEQRRRAQREEAVQQVEKFPSREAVAEALSLGVSPKELKKIAKQQLLKALRQDPSSATKIEEAFAAVGFSARLVGSKERADATRSFHRDDAQHSARALQVSAWVDGPGDARRALELVQKVRRDGALPKAQLLERAADLWLHASARSQWPSEEPELLSSLAHQLRAEVESLAGQDARLVVTEEHARRISQEVDQRMMERVSADPWRMIMGPEGQSGWFEGLTFRFDPDTGAPLPRHLVDRMEQGLVRLWDNFVHRTDLPSELRDRWINHLRDEYPELEARLSRERPVYYGGSEARTQLSKSVFAATPEWSRFVNAILERFDVETSASDLRLALRTILDRPKGPFPGAPALAEFREDRLVTFATEALNRL